MNFNKIEHQILHVAYVPVVMIIFDVLRGFMGGIGTMETMIFLAYTLYYAIFIKDILKINYWITIFLFYAFILATFSSNSVKTYENYCWVLISLLMFPIAYKQIRTLADLRKVNIASIILIFIFVINGIITSQMGIGENPYGGSFVMGAFTFTKLYSGSIVLILLPLLLPEAKSPIIKFIILFFSVILYSLLFLSLRRTAMAIPVLGYVIYFIFSSHKKLIIIGFASVIFLMVGTYPLYQGILESQLSARSNVFDEAYNPEEEGRYLEGQVVLDERLGNNVSWWTALLGKEVFNEYGKYADGFYGDRQIHVDYYKIIYTLGILGMLLYLMIFVDIWSKYRNLRKYIPNEIIYKEMKGIFITLFIISFVVSFMGGILTVTFRAMIFIYLGGILGIYSNISELKESK